MTCRNCGAPITEGEARCAVCGVPTEPPTPRNVRSTPILIFGLLGVGLGFSVIPGVLFSLLALFRARAFTRETGVLFGKAKAGKILATAGLILSAAALIGWAALLVIRLVRPEVFSQITAFFG